MAGTSHLLPRLPPTLPPDTVQLLQSIGDGLEEKEKDFRIAAEIGQMLVEKNKQLIEQNADVEASFQVQLEKKDADLRAADQKQKQLAKRIDELQARSTDEIGTLESRVAELRTQLKEAMSYKTKTQQLFDELQEKKTNLESDGQEIDELRRQNAKLRQELSKEASGATAELQAEVTRLRAELDAVRHGDVALKKLQKENMQLRAENIELKEKLHEKENMQELIDSVMRVSREHQERESEYKRLLAAARAQSDALSAELEDLRAGRSPTARSLADELQPPPAPAPAPSLADELGGSKSEPQGVVERTRLIELLAQLRSQSAELAKELTCKENELQQDKRTLDQLQRRVVAVNQQIRYMEPNLTEDSKHTFSEHQAALAQVLKEELDKHSAAENRYQEKMQQAQFMREKHTELEDRIRTLQRALDAHEGDVVLSEKLLRDESHEALVKEVIRLRSEFKRARQEEEAFIARLVELRRRLSAADARKAGSGRGVNPRDTVALCTITGESVIRDARNLNITRDKVLLWQATDLLIECASVRLRLNEAELRTYQPPLDLPSPSGKEEQKAKPLPATPSRGPPASPTAATKPAASSSPFKRVMGFFGSSSSKPVEGKELNAFTGSTPEPYADTL